MKKKMFFLIFVLLFIIVGCTKNEIDSKNEQQKIPEKELFMPSIFSDNMMFQQDKNIRLFGKADNNISITISLVEQKTNKQIIKTTTKSDQFGNWLIELPPIKGSYKEYQLHVTDGYHELTYENILIGELWLAAGQSNMAIELKYIIDGNKYLNEANNENIRIFYQNIPGMDANYSYEEKFDVDNGVWVRANIRHAIANCSGIGYTFAVELFSLLNQNDEVPIGIINTARGGSSIHAWLSRFKIENTSYIKEKLKQANHYLTMENWNQQGNQNYNQMTALYNEIIAPLTNLNIRGVLWYQGENDVGDADYYYHALIALIEDWSFAFQQNNKLLPFAIIQLAPYGNENATEKLPNLRLSQLNVHKHFEESTVIIPIHDIDLTWDYGDFKYKSPIHPLCKAPVGIRTARSIYSLIYNDKVDYQAPIIEDYRIEDGKVYISFKHAELLKIPENNNEIKTVEIITTSGIKKSVETNIVKQNELVISNLNLDEVEYIQYGFHARNENSNLFNEKNIPVVPFKFKIEKKYSD